MGREWTQVEKEEREQTRLSRRARLVRWLGLWAADLLLTGGGALISAGAAMIYPPAGMIAAGVFLIAGGVLWARGGVGS